MKPKKFGLIILGCAGITALALSASALTATSNSPSPQSATSPRQLAQYRNDQWHFSLDVPSNFTVDATDIPGGVTVQFIEPSGDELFQVSAWSYQDFDVALGEKGAASNIYDQPDTLGIVHAYDGDLFQLTFQKNGVGYTVQALPENATSTLDILKSWEFI